MCGEVVVALMSVESEHRDLRKLVLSENSAYWCTHTSHSGLVSFRDAYGGLYLWKGSAISGLGSDKQRRLAWLYSTCVCATYEEPSQWLLKAHENENESFVLLICWSLHPVSKMKRGALVLDTFSNFAAGLGANERRIFLLIWQYLILRSS